MIVLAILALQASRLQVGTAWSGQETLHFLDRQAEIDETHTFKLSFKVTGQQEKMWTVERRSTLLGTRIGETSLPPSSADGPAVTKEWLSPMGFLLDAEPFDSGTLELDRLIHFWLPENRPDQWDVDLKTVSDHFVDKGKATFKRIERPNPSPTSREYTLKFSDTDDPTGIEATGRLRFDLATGRLLRADIEGHRARLPGGRERANVTLTYLDSQE